MDHARVAPRPLPFHLLEEITDGFSEDRKLGTGAYGSVYKGQHKDGETIAIKKLHNRMARLNDELFEKEYLNLASLEHENIVRLVGYCNETRREYIKFDGRMVPSEIPHMALCFEYMCNGSLANYLQDESTGEEWHTRYAIIKGICKGLKYLHEELNPPVYHLDLKPDNILLDGKMTPKIADFGLSKLFGDGTRVSASPIGTIGYLSPEYINSHVVSNKLDIFSLGVIIIKLMMGPIGYSQTADMSSEEFIELTHGKWRKRLQRTSDDLIESYAEQVKTCIRIALSCVEEDRHKRPTIGGILSELEQTETTGQFSHALTINRGSTTVGEEALLKNQPTYTPTRLWWKRLKRFSLSCIKREQRVSRTTSEMSPSMSIKNGLVDELEGELLNIRPRQLRFPFFEPNKSISCSLCLSNNMDVDVAFRVLQKLPERYIDGLSKLSSIVPPRCTRTFVVWMEKQPPANLDKFDVTIESCIANDEIADVDDNFIPDIIELTEGNKVHEVTLMASIFEPSGEKGASEIGPRTKIICNIDEESFILAMDTHPTEPWILTGHFDCSISVWNYETQARVLEFKIGVQRYGEIRTFATTIKFIACNQWIVAGDNYGRIHVRSCVTTDEVKKFQAHSSWMQALEIHPSLPLVLSASDDKLIKLWDWEKDWMCLRTFKNNPCYYSVMFNPNSDNTSSITFTSVTLDGTVKIWKPSHPLPIATYNCKSEDVVSQKKSDDVVSFDYLPQAGGGAYIVTGSSNTLTNAGVARVWDLETEQCVQEITGLQTAPGCNLSVVDCSPDRPLLVVALHDHTVGLYNLTTCRYENIFIHNLGRIRRFSYIKAIRSVAVAHEGGLALLEID